MDHTSHHTHHIPEHSIFRVFFWSLLLKGLFTVVEGFAAALVLLASVLSFHSGTFISAYILAYCIIKIILITNILRNKIWAYPASLIIFGLFALYQVFEIVKNLSIFLILVTIFDVFLISLIWHEYEVVKTHIAKHSGRP